MALTKNPNVLKWIEEMTALTKPDKVVWIDGSKAQLDELTNEALSTGEMQKLNEDKFPGCLYHRTKPNDVARVEDRTFICSRNKAHPDVRRCNEGQNHVYHSVFDGSYRFAYR